MLVRQTNLGALKAHTNYHALLFVREIGHSLRVQQALRKLPSLSRKVVGALQVLVFQGGFGLVDVTAYLGHDVQLVVGQSAIQVAQVLLGGIE